LNYPTAEKYFNLALKKLETVAKCQEKVEYLNILHKQGLLALAKGNTNQAIQKFESAQNCYEKLENPDKGFRRAYVDIGEGMIKTYIELNKLEEAYKLCNQAIKLIGQLGGESLASFDNSIKRMIHVMLLQLEAAGGQKQKGLVGNQLKQLLYNPEEAQEIPELKEVVSILNQFKPEILQALIDCYSDINVEETDYWIKERNNLKEKGETTPLEAKEKYYIQTTLLNAISTNKTVQHGTIEIKISSRGRQALSKELWENLNESERKEIKYNPKVENLDLESLTTKPQEAIRDLLQANITEVVQYVYTSAKERKIEDIRPLIETVACTLSKGIIKVKSDKVEEQAAYRESRQVCHLEGKALRIDDFSSFIEFLKKRHINTKAYSEETVYGKKFVDRDKKVLKPEHMASSLAEYLKSGIIINYQHHTHWDKGLLSTNLSQSLNDFAADLVKDIAENKESSKEERSKEEARILFEALILDILNRANLKEVFPISLKEGQEKAISIFSNEIEKEGYLLKGSVFRFLRAINNIILKEKGTKLSDSALDKISRDVLKMVIAKELPREEEKLIKYLPQVIESALYAATKKT
jgi:hypothetical protein